MTPDYYMKLTVGELAAQVAMLRTEIDRLRDELAARRPGKRPTAPTDTPLNLRGET